MFFCFVDFHPKSGWGIWKLILWLWFAFKGKNKMFCLCPKDQLQSPSPPPFLPKQRECSGNKWFARRMNKLCRDGKSRASNLLAGGSRVSKNRSMCVFVFVEENKGSKKKKKEVRTTRCGRRKKKPHLSGVCAKGHSSRIASAKQGFLLLFLFATDLTAK